MTFIIIFLIIIIIVCSYLIFKIKKNNKIAKNREKFSVLKKQETNENTSEIEKNKIIKKEPDNIEILDLNDSSRKIEAKADTLDLDDLFKTISLSKVEEEKQFDFTLQREEKK